MSSRDHATLPSHQCIPTLHAKQKQGLLTTLHDSVYQAKLNTGLIGRINVVDIVYKVMDDLRLHWYSAQHSLAEFKRSSFSLAPHIGAFGHFSGRHTGERKHLSTGALHETTTKQGRGKLTAVVSWTALSWIGDDSRVVFLACWLLSCIALQCVAHCRKNRRK